VLAPTDLPPTDVPPPTSVPPTATEEDEEDEPDPTPTASVVPGGPGAIAGRITDERGEPLPGARVEALRLGRPGGADDPGPDAVTDQDGRYLIAGLVPGNYHVVADHLTRGIHPRWFRDANRREDAEVVAVTAGLTTEGIDIELDRRGGPGPGPGPGRDRDDDPPPASPEPTATPETTATPGATGEAP
jgi:hypothetical protein